MSGTIYADLRCLQDRDFRDRGIGYHTAALLRGRKRSQLSAWKMIGLVDQGMGPLRASFRALVDEISPLANPSLQAGLNVFIDGSPMTHDLQFTIRLQYDRRLLRAAVLYDFIPLDWPGYLPTVGSRIEYLAKLARVKYFDLFFPISKYTAGRLSALLGVSPNRVTVTGACVRRSLYELRNSLGVLPSPDQQTPPYFVSLGGDDRRKNTEVALKAVQRLNLLYSRLIPLKVIGFYCDAYKRDLLRLAGHEEGAGFLELYPHISDKDVVALHAGAIAAIAPSRIEGFSLPIAEAAVCGCPVLAANCDAQMELVPQPEALFQPDDSVGLATKLEALLQSPALRASLVAEQAHLAPKFHEEAVASRFWKGIELSIENRGGMTVAARPRKPRLAFLSPYPPDSSLAASYTAMTMKAGSAWFDSDIYTDSARPLIMEDISADCGFITPSPLLDRRYEATISVLGSSSSYRQVLDVFDRFGGPCILHDVRLTQLYFELLGSAELRRFAREVLERPVSKEEVRAWLQDRDSPMLFVERAIKRARPLMVHTVTQQSFLKKRYGAEAHILTFCPTEIFDREELTEGAKNTLREKYGISSDTFLIASFGRVGPTSGMGSSIMALDLLRSWGIPAELYFAGNAEPYDDEIRRICGMYAVTPYVHCGKLLADETVFRDFLIASDAGIHLEAYEYGKPSTVLTNCISAGLPVLANRAAANTCDSPAFMFALPDRYSPLHIAEQLALIWEARSDRAAREEERAAFLQTHNFAYYAKRLSEILGIA